MPAGVGFVGLPAMNDGTKVLLVSLAIYFPILVVVTPFNELLPLNKVWYSVALLLGFIFFNVLSRGCNLARIEGALALLSVSIYWLAVLLVSGLLAGQMRAAYLEGIGLILGIFVTAAVLITYDREPSASRIARWIEKAGFILGLCLIVQTAFSLSESISGEFYLHNEAGHFDVYTYFDQRARSFLTNIHGLKFALSGLILQHNNFGVQLAFLNVFFALLYYVSRRRAFLFFMGVVLFALLLNTTRAAMIGVLVTDVILWSALSGRLAQAALFIALPIIVYLFLGSALIGFEESVGSGTLAYRFGRWLALYRETLESIGLLQALFGGSAFSLGSTFSVGRSVENQFIYMVLFYGLFGLAMFIHLFVWIPVRLTATASPEIRSLAFAFALNVGVLSMAMDNLFFAAIFPIMCLILIYLSLVAREQRGDPAAVL